MIRFLEIAPLILLPFAVYGLWLYGVKRSEQRGWNTAPWFWLFISGLLLFAASFLALGLMEEGGGGRTYIPPHTVDGVIAPAETK